MGAVSRLLPGCKAWFSGPAERPALTLSSPGHADAQLEHTLGLVTMDVELADRTPSVAVTPVQAAAVVLLYFQDQGELPATPRPRFGHTPGEHGLSPEEGGAGSWLSLPAPSPRSCPSR